MTNSLGGTSFEVSAATTPTTARAELTPLRLVDERLVELAATAAELVAALAAVVWAVRDDDDDVLDVARVL